MRVADSLPPMPYRFAGIHPERVGRGAANNSNSVRAPGAQDAAASCSDGNSCREAAASTI